MKLALYILAAVLALVVLFERQFPIHAEEVERSTAVEKCIIFRDADAAKVNEAVLNFLKSEPAISHVLQSESTVLGVGRSPNSSYYYPSTTGNILTITIFYRDKK